jgi:hypothetical protein
MNAGNFNRFLDLRLAMRMQNLFRYPGDQSKKALRKY